MHPPNTGQGLPNPNSEASMTGPLTWTLFAAVGGVGTDGLSTGQARTLHLLTVHLSSGPLLVPIERGCQAEGRTTFTLLSLLSPPQVKYVCGQCSEA